MSQYPYENIPILRYDTGALLLRDAVLAFSHPPATGTRTGS